MTDLFPLAMFTWGLLIGIALTNLYLRMKYDLKYPKVKNEI
jgi:hypothetical protein